MLDLETGKVYSIQKIDKVVLVNFPTESSVKVRFFDKIKLSERNKLKRQIDEMCSIDLRVDDSLGKIFVISMYLLSLDTDMIIVNTPGLSNQSILFLEENLSIVAEKLMKTIIVTHCNTDQIVMKDGVIVG